MNAAQQALKLRLAGDGGWMGRQQISAGLDWTEGRIDDELAELVMRGDVLWNERTREYRLAGSPVARRALAQLVASGERRRVLGRHSPDNRTYQVGIAQRIADPDGGEMLVMGELELDYPAGDGKALQQLTHALCGAAL